LQEVLSEANQELQSSLLLLKDAAGTAFIPGYQPSSSGRTSSRRSSAFTSYSSILNSSSGTQASSSLQPGDVESVPARLQRLLTGQFIREAQGGSSSSSSNQPFDVRLAAIQFELQQQLQAEEAASKQQQQQQPKQGVVDASGVVVDVASEPLAQGGSNGANTAPATASAATSSSSSSSSSAAAAADEPLEQQAQQTETYPATTYMLAIVTWTVFLLQWWPALPELWKLLQQAGPVKAATALLFMYPDTATTRALCLVSVGCAP
jgi:hypothetical protein